MELPASIIQATGNDVTWNLSKHWQEVADQHKRLAVGKAPKIEVLTTGILWEVADAMSLVRTAML